MEGFDLVESLSIGIKRKSEGIAMVKIKVDEDACVGCGSCVEDCPNDVYELDQENGKTVVVKETDCMACLSCHEICPSQALEHDDIHVAKRLYIDRKVNKALSKII